MSNLEQSFSVSGMHCAACSSRIERVVSALTGVESASVNLATEQMNCVYDNTVIDENLIVERVTEIGFGLAPAKSKQEDETEIEFSIKGMHCAACSTRIEKVLGSRDSIHAADVNLASEQATVRFDPSKINVREIREAIEEGDQDAIEDELGDLLFVVTNLARQIKVDPARALRRANAKFERRFRSLEVEAGGEAAMEAMELEEMEALWQTVKRREGEEET